MPPRKLFGEAELKIVAEVFADAWLSGVDFGYQGPYEDMYVKQVVELQGGGYADAVSSGTAAIYLALMALDLPVDCEIMVSPVTDPGGVSPVIMAGMRPRIADAEQGSFNMSARTFAAALTPRTRAAIITHVGGRPCDLAPMMQVARDRQVFVIEDCSQAHGALDHGQRVGRLGDIATFSTMFSKQHATGGCGGLVYTQSSELFRRARAFADRGKSFGTEGYDSKDPSTFLFPALNFNLDELSCAIGYSTLGRLEETIRARLRIATMIDRGLSKRSEIVTPIPWAPESVPSLYFHTVRVRTERLSVPKVAFAKAIQAEGIGLNPDYRLVASEWPWLRKYAPDDSTPNAAQFRDQTFNLLLNERYGDAEVEDILAAIIKVEKVLRK